MHFSFPRNLFYILIVSACSILFVFQVHNQKSQIVEFSQPYRYHISDTASQHPFGLCVFILGTFFDEEHTNETTELMVLYSGREEVFFFMDTLSNNTNDANTCVKHNVKCIFLTWDRSFNGTNLNRKLFISLVTIKAQAMFRYILTHEMHKQCKFMMKLDCDAYVNIDYYSFWLNSYFNYTDALYIGQPFTCPGKPHAIWMIQGTYTLSQGVFINHPELTFEGNTSLLTIPRPTLSTDYDDCSIGYIMTHVLHIDLIDVTRYTFWQWYQHMLNEIWEHKMDDKQRICKWMCHKCSSRLRRHFAAESEWLHKHQSIEHCANGGYWRYRFEPNQNKSYHYNRYHHNFDKIN